MKTPLTLTDNEVLACPFSAYKQLRDEHPVYKDPVSGTYIVSRYEDIRAVAGNPALFSNTTGRLSDVAFSQQDEAARILAEKSYPHINTLVTADPPVHTKYRSLVDKTFTVSRVNGLKPYIEEIANMMVDRFCDKGAVDFVPEMAIPMPLYIIADQLGVPRERYLDFKRWSDASVLIADTRLPEDARAGFAHSIIEKQQYLAQRTHEYRAQPEDNIFSAVVNTELDGRQLSVEEVVSIFSQLLIAGNETTTHTMSMGLHYMIKNGLENELRADLSKVPNFVEEVLRLTTSLQGLYRRATQDTELCGVHIPKDSIVMLRWAAGNRDERRFENPDVLDLSRKDAQRHLTFGYGTHFCIGNQLARAELNTAFRVLLTRLKNFRMVDEPDAEQWIIHAFARGMSRLKIEFDKA